MTTNTSEKSVSKDQTLNQNSNCTVASCIHFQAKLAARMQRRSDQFSLKIKTVTLLLFCLLASSFSIYLIANNLLSNQADNVLKVTPINYPRYTKLSRAQNTAASIVINQAEYQKIHEFRRYIDSLANTASGKRFLDSILKQRPGLMDSIEFLENIYQSQNKN
ncbi:hypothetical protein [Rubrolithibacter danxiaensis]|uniref:hypothetical protein n=1 Tax=Rubrolithibacter danxiaensis TaxID=3390805 RepID=UPI003BF8F6AF